MDSNPGKFSASDNEVELLHGWVSIHSDHHIVERCRDPPFLPTSCYPYNSAAVSGETLEEDFVEDRALSTAMLKYMGDMLMDDELEDRNCMFQDRVALLAAEKSFYDVLGSPSPPQPPPDVSMLSSGSNSNVAVDNFVESEGVESASIASYILQPIERRGSKNQHPGEGGDSPGRCGKRSAFHREEPDESSELFDRVLFPSDGEGSKKLQEKEQGKSLYSKKGRVKKKGNKGEVVDLRALLTQCAQAIAANNQTAANDILKLIRQHSSPLGNGSQRLAHFFANGLEARLAGTGSQMHRALATKRTSVADVIKAYQLYVSVCPFQGMSHRYANQVIARLAQGATRLHIIDFGVLYGFQWPCLIQFLSLRPGGPPKLRITGVDFPQPGFRPAERVEKTGRRLANYCKRFKVPFEYKAIAQRWDTIRVEDLEIDKDEVLVVNSIYRMKNLPDETGTEKCLRDAVLELIRRINPDIFVHGVLNGNFNIPFFFTRFREALFHFDALFDMLDTSVPRQEEGRMMFERAIYGKEIMNITACEGSERIERPNLYKQWQARNERAGFKQLPLEQEILMKMRSIVKMDYHKDFTVEVDGEWMLQGWKGRVIYAISSWKPSHHL